MFWRYKKAKRRAEAKPGCGGGAIIKPAQRAKSPVYIEKPQLER
ncbi:hypothetical protein [Viridibacterium curvum]